MRMYGRTRLSKAGRRPSRDMRSCLGCRRSRRCGGSNAVKVKARRDKNRRERPQGQFLDCSQAKDLARRRDESEEVDLRGIKV